VAGPRVVQEIGRTDDVEAPDVADVGGIPVAVAAAERLDLLGAARESEHLRRELDADGQRRTAPLPAPAVEAVAAGEVEDLRARDVAGELLERVRLEVKAKRLELRFRIAIADPVVFRSFAHAASSTGTGGR